MWRDAAGHLVALLRQPECREPLPTGTPSPSPRDLQCCLKVRQVRHRAPPRYKMRRRTLTDDLFAQIPDSRKVRSPSFQELRPDTPTPSPLWSSARVFSARRAELVAPTCFFVL